jgi:hypothetical protein
MTAAVACLSGDSRAWEAASRRTRQYMARHFNEQEMLEPYLAALSSLYAIRSAPSAARQEL